MPKQTRVYATPAAEQSAPSISVIIPCYNHGDFLTKAVESVLTQPVREVEIIIVNDGSTDRSKHVALELIERYPHRAIRVVDQPNSGEPAISRNNGINLARGEYILPLDADDHLAPGVLTRYLEAVEPYRGNSIVAYGWMQRFGAQNSIWKTRKFHPNELLRKGKLPNCSLFSRSLWESHGGYQLGIPGYEDWEFWIACAAQGARFIHLPEVVYFYRTTEQDSMGKSGRRRHEWLMAKIFRMHKNLYEDEELDWAKDYIARYPEPPAEREIHGPCERFPTAVALLIAAYHELYEPGEIRWAAEYLDRHPPVQHKGLRTMSVPDRRNICSSDVREDQSSQPEALQVFREAQHLFVAERFSEAEKHIACYRKKINYDIFEREDRRRKSDPSVSVIVVAYQTKQLLLECLESLMSQKREDFEIILVDNGGNDEVFDALKTFPLLHIHCPINLVLSEGRNIGAHFARGRILAFLDDDALVNDNYVASLKQAFDTYDIIALRGKVLPKTHNDNDRYAPHYDYGDTPIPATVNTEGNSAILRQTYLEIGGQDPLLFGAEGMEMSYRIFNKHGDNRIIYWPETIIHHDYAVTDDKLKSKLDRYERVKRYLTGKYGDIFNWHYGYERYRKSDEARRWGESLIPPIFDHRSPIIDDQQSTIDNRKVVLEKALSEKGWLEKLPLYEKVFDEVQELQKVETPEASIVVISWRLHPDTRINFQMLELQRDEGFELIFVDNGGKPGEFDTLKPFINTYICLNSNTGAYLARNIGAVFAKAPLLIFLEDDGIPWENFVHSHLEAHRTFDIIAARGVYVPKTRNPLNQHAKHYYPGERCFPIFADVEGNVSYKATAFFSVNGWDDEIRFGGGGFDLSRRLLNLDPDMRKQIYSPHPRIYHDYAHDDEHLRNKREKQDMSRQYLRRKHSDYDKFLESWNPYSGREDLIIPKRKPETQTAVGSQKELIGSNRTVRQTLELMYHGHWGAARARLDKLSRDPQTASLAHDMLRRLEQMEKETEEVKSPRVSILIPTFNRADYIATAVVSALEQSVSPFEIIVVDDGSTDGTPEIVASINDPRIRYVHKEHSGAPATRNRAVREAKGDFILWLDSDDALLPDALENYLSILNRYPDADVLYGDLIVSDADLKPNRSLCYPDWWENKSALLACLHQKNAVPNPGTMIRKTCYDRIGYYDESFPRAHDYDWWVRLAPVARFKHCGKFVVLWRWHEANMSSGSVKIDYSYDVRIVRGMLERHTLRELYPQIDWERIPRAQAEAAALLQTGQNLIGLGDKEGGVDCLRLAYQHLPNEELRALLTSFNINLDDQAPVRIRLAGDVISSVIPSVSVKETSECDATVYWTPHNPSDATTEATTLLSAAQASLNRSDIPGAVACLRDAYELVRNPDIKQMLTELEAAVK